MEYGPRDSTPARQELRRALADASVGRIRDAALAVLNEEPPGALDECLRAFDGELPEDCRGTTFPEVIDKIAWRLKYYQEVVRRLQEQRTERAGAVLRYHTEQQRLQTTIDVLAARLADKGKK